MGSGIIITVHRSPCNGQPSPLNDWYRVEFIVCTIHRCLGIGTDRASSWYAWEKLGFSSKAFDSNKNLSTWQRGNGWVKPIYLDQLLSHLSSPTELLAQMNPHPGEPGPRERFSGLYQLILLACLNLRLEISFPLTCVDNQPMRTAPTSGREIQTFHEDDWTSRIPPISLVYKSKICKYNPSLFPFSSCCLLSPIPYILVTHIRSLPWPTGFCMLIASPNNTLCHSTGDSFRHQMQQSTLCCCKKSMLCHDWCVSYRWTTSVASVNRIL